MIGELNLTKEGNRVSINWSADGSTDIKIGGSLWLILSKEQVQALKYALGAQGISNILPATLETYGKTQCNHCREIVRVKEVSDSERWIDDPDSYSKHLCKECKGQMDKRCECSRNCSECEDYWHCGGCKMPPCEECKANKHLKEAK